MSIKFVQCAEKYELSKWILSKTFAVTHIKIDGKVFQN